MTLDKTAVLVRTHQSNLHVLQFARTWKEHFCPNVIWVCDEGFGTVDSFEFPKLSLTRAVVRRWGFERFPGGWGWLCGDFAYYIAAERLPDFDYFLLVEPDVYASERNIARLAKLLSAQNADAVAARLQETKTPLRMSKNLSQYGLSGNVECLFPITRASRPLIKTMFQIRKKTLHKDGRYRVNDEAVFARAAFDMIGERLDLFEFESLFQKENFRTNPPVSWEQNALRSDERGFLHPALTISECISRITMGKFRRHRMNFLAADTPQHIARTLNRSIVVEHSDHPKKPLGHMGAFGKQDRLGRLLFILPEYDEVRIADVGANPIEGEASYDHLLRSAQANVVGFEPAPDAFEALKEKSASNENYLNLALGDGQTHDLHVTKGSGFSSLHEPDPSSAAYLGFSRPTRVLDRLRVPTHRMDDVDEIKNLDFLKIDIQGSELMVLENARQKMADAILVQSEVRFLPLYKGEPSFGDLESELRNQGFELFKFDFLKKVAANSHARNVLRRNAFSQVVDGDAFFVKDLRSLDKYTNTQLSKLAVLADNVMESFDLALLCLGELEKRGALYGPGIPHYVEAIPPQFKKHA